MSTVMHHHDRETLLQQLTEAQVAELTVTKVVEAGTRLLDSVKPGWVDDVDLLDFDMRELNKCILGQIYGYYTTGHLRLNLTITGRLLHGFSRGGFFEAPYTYSDLTAEWVRVIRERRAKGAQSTGDSGRATEIREREMPETD